MSRRILVKTTVSHCSGNVVSNGKGVDLCFDHHKRTPFENLFTDIDIGAGTRMYKCGGGPQLGINCAARETFWNIRAQKPQGHPGGFGPASMNLVAIETRQSAKTSIDGRWFEVIDPPRIYPQNLHLAQLTRRLDRRADLRYNT